MSANKLSANKLSANKLLKILLLVAVLASALFAGPAYAQAPVPVPPGSTPGEQVANPPQSCSGLYTVQRGETLRSIANRCGTTVTAILRANPQIKDANRIYVGQVLVMPGALLLGDGTYDIYVVARGDTLYKIARRYNTTVNELLRLNPEIKNRNIIYVGQRIRIPAPPVPVPPPVPPTQQYIVVRGDNLRKIAVKFNTTVQELLRLNPSVTNPDLIYPGQVLIVPSLATTYTVQRGDTLKAIALRFFTTVEELLRLNPEIRDPDLIYVGQVLRLR